MFVWLFGFFFSVIGIVLGKIVASGGGKNNEPIYMLGFGVLFAILGALINGHCSGDKRSNYQAEEGQW
ncbi:MAG: hypothetical protein QM703_13955 [Gemmatales bacterium]